MSRVALAVSLAVVACGGPSDTRPHVGVALPSDSASVDQALRRSLIQTAESLHVALTVVTAGSDASRQTVQVDSSFAATAAP